MPGRLFLTGPMDAVARWLGREGEVPDHPGGLDIAPGEVIPALTVEGFGLARWGLIPVGRRNARGRPVMETIVNARSETLFDKTAFAGVTRAVVPISGWYEWTGPARRRTRWRIADAEGGLMAFAAISDVWTAPGGRRVAQVATVTCAPNADVAPIHHRMGVILGREEVGVWMEGDPAAAAALMRPWPEGRLRIEEVPDPPVPGPAARELRA